LANGIAAGRDLFEVVAIDNDDATIEIQYFDGTLEEYDQETWNLQGLVETDAPEDWTGSVDVDQEDYDIEAENPHNAAWSAPVSFSIGANPAAFGNRHGQRRSLSLNKLVKTCWLSELRGKLVRVAGQHDVVVGDSHFNGPQGCADTRSATQSPVVISKHAPCDRHISSVLIDR